jgi:hypothetical protein
MNDMNLLAGLPTAMAYKYISVFGVGDFLRP